MKLAIAIIFALVCHMAVADSAKLCPDTKQYWDGTKCNPCPEGCVECIYTNSKVSCINCGSGVSKFLKVDGGIGTCVACAGNCTDCRGPNAADCIVPAADFVVSPSAIVKCTGVAGCKWCATENKCGKCKYGFRLDNGACTACQDANCVDCPEAVGTCKKCGYKTFLNGTSCLTCNDGCKSCPCKDCLDGYRSENSTCFKCAVANCKSCQANGTECATCNPGFFSKDKTTCAPCDVANCVECTGAGQCSTCAPYFALKDNKECVKFPDFCVKGDKDGLCSECQSGFYLSADKKTCTMCPAGCDGCNTNGECTKCVAGTFLNTDKKGCTQCVAGCQECSDAKTCKTCNSAFNNIVNGTQCKAWSDCQVGQSQDASGTCVAGTIDNCALGMSAAADCYLCASGYYPSSKKCAACPAGCAKCSAGDKGQVICSAVAQKYFSIVHNNNAMDTTGYLGKSYVATVDTTNQPATCMPYALNVIFELNAQKKDCYDYTTNCKVLEKFNDDWRCRMEGTAAKVTISLFALLVAAFFSF